MPIKKGRKGLPIFKYLPVLLKVKTNRHHTGMILFCDIFNGLLQCKTTKTCRKRKDFKKQKRNYLCKKKKAAPMREQLFENIL